MFGRTFAWEYPVNESLGMDFDPRALEGLIHSGGKKKLDTLLEMFRKEGPDRVSEIEKSPDIKDAKKSAVALKASAANLGLLALEDLCDQILAGKDLGSLKGQFRPALSKSLGYLEKTRKTI